MDFSMSRPNRIPVPPKEVLDFFMALNKPDVKRFITRLCNHFEETTDSEVHQHHQCYENVPLTYHELKAPSDINKNEDLTSNNHGNSGSSKLMDLDMNTSDTSESYEENEDVLSLQSISEFVNETSEAVATHSNSMSDQIVSTVNISTSKTSQISHSASKRRTSPRKTPTKKMMTTTPLVKQSPVPATPLKPSSPHCSPFNKESSEAVKYVKLLESHDHRVKADELRRITARAKKEKNPAYSEAYCKKHQLKPAMQSGMNDAVTEAIAYSRKKIKKQMQSETPTK